METTQDEARKEAKSEKSTIQGLRRKGYRGRKSKIWIINKKILKIENIGGTLLNQFIYQDLVIYKFEAQPKTPQPPM